MSKEISVMKRLNSKLRVLKNSKLFIAHTELNGRSSSKGFCGMGVRSEIKDDYVLILDINNKDNIAIAINYNKHSHVASIVASTGDTIKVDYKHKRTENIHRSNPYSFEEFSERLRNFNKILNTLTSKNVSETFSEIMDIKDPERMSDKEKEEKAKEMVETLTPLYKKSGTLQNNIKKLEDKIFVSNISVNKEIRELPESIKLAQLMKEIAILQGVVDSKRKEAFAPILELKKECAVEYEKFNDTNIEIENYEVIFGKQLPKKYFGEVIKSIIKK